ncbi:Stage V sporulation protein D [Candidatus Arthromitus sp. SFB-1]|nr:Stage V sporulation protein D [Candidatus Arthromitus sp. SFB-1]
MITAIAAIEEGLVSESDTFVCNGHKEVGGRIIHCWKRTGHGTLDFKGVLQNSCNVGTMEIGERLGAEKLSKYIEKFGFGQKTGLDLSGEAKGIIKKVENISTVDLATISFGQTNTTTPIQFLAAVNAVANDGVWVRPHFMKEVSHYDDEFNYIVDENLMIMGRNVL